MKKRTTGKISGRPLTPRTLGRISGWLLLISFGFFITWVYSVYSYGYWVDEHNTDAHYRAIDFILFGTSALAFAGSIWTFVVRNKQKAREDPPQG